MEALARQIGVESLEAMPRDVSPREYFRGIKGGRRFVVMRYPHIDADSRAEMLEFIRIGQWLSGQGLKVPELYDCNEEQCYALFEDLGSVSFGQRLKSDPQEQEELYALATDVLKVLGKAGVPDALPDYRQSRIHENRRQLVDYYMTWQRGEHPGEATVQSYLAVWDEIEKNLPPCPQGFLHADYHLENLKYLSYNSDLKRCALIDYQDALYGPLPYDLVNLLEDARVDVPVDIRHEMIERYCEGMAKQDKEVFLQWYRVLATQFHGRVIGLFIKLAAEQRRDSYLIHISRLQDYIQIALQDPLLAQLKDWFEQEGVDFRVSNGLDGNQIRTVFQNISF